MESAQIFDNLKPPYLKPPSLIIRASIFDNLEPSSLTVCPSIDPAVIYVQGHLEEMTSLSNSSYTSS